jgi:hypothetical protein
MRRLEPYPRSHGIEDGLAARIHDPLWMLTRQWQFGEFKAEDAASPAYVDVGTEVHLVDQWRPHDGAEWLPYDRTVRPLERLVEQEPAGDHPRLRLEGGLELRRLLKARSLSDLLPRFTVRFPFPPALSGGASAAVRARLPDGAKLHDTMLRLQDDATRDAEADALEVPEPARAPLAEVAADWLRWWLARTIGSAQGLDPGAWDPNRLEYAFAARSTTLPDTMLTAAEYVGGRLDWWSFDAAPATPADRPDDTREPGRPALRAVPAPARFGGMPTPRFWEMEDARFDPGAVDAAPNDLGRLLMVTFATVYGNDWFTVPLRLPVSSLSQVTRFAVTDIFGTTADLTPAGANEPDWQLFELTDIGQPLTDTRRRPTSPWFFLPPALPDAQESDAVEAVLLLRDEMANLAWAVEATIADDAGRPVDRLAQWAARPLPEPEPLAVPRYRVDTRVPDHWFPLAPEQLENHRSIKLRLVPLARRVAGNADPPPTLPSGVLLAGADEGRRWLYEEEVPRAGARVVRTHQYARWHDGSIQTWTARRKTSGGGEGSSGLRYDVVESEE